MSLRPTRSTIAIAVAFVFLMSLLPAGFADFKSFAAQQPSAGRTRRGKNGTVDSNSALPQNTQSAATGPKQSQREAQSDSQPGSTGSDPAPIEPEPKASAPEGSPRSSGGLSSTSSSESGQSRVRRDPPPFDRPPVNSSQSGSTGDSSAETRKPTGGVQRRSDSSDTADADPPSSTRRDSETSERGRSTEPVLRRPADSRSPSRSSDSDSTDPERGRGEKPVLRRPSDPPDSGQTSRTPNRAPQSQSNPPPANDGDDVLRLDSTLINIPILVSDRSGHYVPRLSARDFLLYEDGVQQEVAFFGSEEVPFNVALVLDMSPSVQGSNDHIHDAAIEFVRQLRANDRVMVVSFDKNVRFLTDFTNNRRTLESAILSTSTGSGTSVYDAVYEVVERFRQVEGRKALILFSDGEDTTSRRAGYDEAIDEVTESDVLVYGLRYPAAGGGNVRVNPWPRNVPQLPVPIPWPWPWPRRRGHFTGANNQPASNVQNWPRRSRDFMADVTTAGGGPVLDAQAIGDLRGLANRIAEELRHVYVISYYPTNSLSNGGFRSIRIRVKGRDELAVRHRRGYNARDVKRGT